MFSKLHLYPLYIVDLLFLLWHQRSKAPLSDHFVRRPSVCLSVRLSVRLSHFWFADNFFTLRDRAFIFGKCVSYFVILIM